MEAQELFTKEAKPTGVFFCGNCKIVSRDRDLAEKCCMPRICEDCKVLEVEKYYTVCPSCRKEKERQKELDIIAKAEKLIDCEGFVFCDELSEHNEGYFESLEELLEYCNDSEDDDEDFQWPEYAFTCTAQYLKKLDAREIVYDRYSDEMYEGFEDHLKGIEELQKAMDIFHELNNTACSYSPNYRQVIVIQKKPKDSKEE